MKTSKFLYLFILLFSISLASCLNDDSDNENIKQKELPENAKVFLTQFLPDNKFVSAKKREPQDSGYIYEVELAGGVHISFNSDGIWSSIDCVDGVPHSAQRLINSGVLSQLKAENPNTTITSLTNYSYRPSVYVVLDNDKRLWDMSGFEGYVLGEQVENTAEIPQKMRNFIAKHIPHPIEQLNIIKFAESEGIVYRLAMGSLVSGRHVEVVMHFYSDGEWFDIKDGGARLLGTVFIKAIPEEILNAVAQNFPNASVSSLIQVSRHDNDIYSFNFGNTGFITIDAERKVVEAPLDKIKEYINRAFNSTGSDELDFSGININWSHPYSLSYIGEIRHKPIKKLTIHLETDRDGEMIQIRATELDGALDRTIELPATIIELLPATTVNHIRTHYNKAKIYSIVRSSDALMLLLMDDRKILYFDNVSGGFVKEEVIITE